MATLYYPEKNCVEDIAKWLQRLKFIGLKVTIFDKNEENYTVPMDGLHSLRLDVLTCRFGGVGKTGVACIVLFKRG